MEQYWYMEGTDRLEKFTLSDSNGRVISAWYKYSAQGSLEEILQLDGGTSPSDTLYHLTVNRDQSGRVISYRLFSKYEFTYNVNDPESFEYTRIGADYVYNENNELIIATSGVNLGLPRTVM